MWCTNTTCPLWTSWLMTGAGLWGVLTPPTLDINFVNLSPLGRVGGLPAPKPLDTRTASPICCSTHQPRRTDYSHTYWTCFLFPVPQSLGCGVEVKAGKQSSWMLLSQQMIISPPPTVTTPQVPTVSPWHAAPHGLNLFCSADLSWLSTLQSDRYPHWNILTPSTFKSFKWMWKCEYCLFGGESTCGQLKPHSV